MGDLKKALLTNVYEIYSAIEEDFPCACRKSCSVCCTRNVVATSLEGELIVQSMSPESE